MLKLDAVMQRCQRSHIMWFALAMPAILLMSIILGNSGSSLLVAWSAVGVLITICMLAMRQNELAVVSVIMVVRLYIDWYWGVTFGAVIAACGLLMLFFLTRSYTHPWTELKPLWLWFLFVVLAIFPTTRALSLLDGVYYYSTNILSAPVMFWLGAVTVRDRASMKHIMKLLAFFGTLIALHTIFSVLTGVFLFRTSRYDLYLAQVGGYIVGSGVARAGSFLINPDSSGTFFAIMLFPPLSLFVESIGFTHKIYYLLNIFCVLLALLFTYSTGAWGAALAGLLVFVAFTSRGRLRFYLPLILVAIALSLFWLFPTQVALQIQHASDPLELALRNGAWQTGLHVIQSFPWTGIGMGRNVYIQRADPYRGIEQFIPLYHPHNSYIELAALGGIPLLIIFLLLLGWVLCRSIQNWRRVDVGTRTLIAAVLGAVTVISLNSLVNAVWTLAPLAAIGWFLSGIAASPSLQVEK